MPGHSASKAANGDGLTSWHTEGDPKLPVEFSATLDGPYFVSMIKLQWGEYCSGKVAHISGLVTSSDNIALFEDYTVSVTAADSGAVRLFLTHSWIVQCGCLGSCR